MTDPGTLTVGAIAALALSKFLEIGAGEAAKKLTPAVLSKMDALRAKIWAKLRGNPVAKKLQGKVEKNEKVTEQEIQELTPLLEEGIKEDAVFAEEIQQLAKEINQEIEIGEILGKNVQNVYGGSPVQINDPTAPVFTGNIEGGVHFNY
ncbi:hypothetical protein [Myxosarcina sp. GI1]|uniref:hypothetical protein n=1 Tax=Myxosarcina sp. GI1 TaxID=1541065 RepID=UPI0005620CD7|nr:hypothetical protein [Myxosarcina sp. GI1]